MYVIKYNVILRFYVKRVGLQDEVGFRCFSSPFARCTFDPGIPPVYVRGSEARSRGLNIETVFI